MERSNPGRPGRQHGAPREVEAVVEVVRYADTESKSGVQHHELRIVRERLVRDVARRTASNADTASASGQWSPRPGGQSRNRKPGRSGHPAEALAAALGAQRSCDTDGLREVAVEVQIDDVDHRVRVSDVRWFDWIRCTVVMLARWQRPPRPRRNGRRRRCRGGGSRAAGAAVSTEPLPRRGMVPPARSRAEHRERAGERQRDDDCPHPNHRWNKR